MRLHSRLIGPTILFTSVLCSLILSITGIAPQLSSLLRTLFESSGIWLLTPIVFVEYLYGFNFFFPGALTILFAMASSAGDLQRAILVFFNIWIVSVLGLYLSFRLGVRSNASCAPLRDSPNRRWSFVRRFFCFAMYAHPLTASIRSFQSGVNGVPTKTFLLELIPSNVFWNIFWGTVSYKYGQVLTSGNAFAYILFAYSIIWLVREFLAEPKAE